MKQLKHIATFSIAIMLFATACKKDNVQSDTSPLNSIVKVTYDSSNQYAFPLENVALTVKNTFNSSVLTDKTSTAGLAWFNRISAAEYDIKASITLTAQEYLNITGIPLNDATITFSGSLTVRPLRSNTNDTLRIVLNIGRAGDWVLKQIYYAGSNTVTGAVQRDQFIEIYNNSNKLLYADSLYVSQAFGSNTIAPDYTTGFYISDNSSPFKGQYDWSKSLGMTMGSAAVTQHWYAKTIFRVPGNGTTYPVPPGESFVIASTALNHKAPYVGVDGAAINILDPSLTVNLSTADFEVYLRDVIPNPFNTDIDNLNVPNMVVIDRGNNRDLVLDNPGREAILIFKTEKYLPLYTTTSTQTADYKKYPDPTVITPIADTRYYYQIPDSIVVDAVQIQHPLSSSRVPRRLSQRLDASATNVPGGQYSSQSLIRKTAKMIGTRRVLKDNNNSSDDFDYLDRATPKGFK